MLNEKIVCTDTCIYNDAGDDIGGVTYEYEEFVVEDTNVKYCFDGSDLKYIITTMDGQEYTMMEY